MTPRSAGSTSAAIQNPYRRLWSSYLESSLCLSVRRLSVRRLSCAANASQICCCCCDSSSPPNSFNSPRPFGRPPGHGVDRCSIHTARGSVMTTSSAARRGSFALVLVLSGLACSCLGVPASEELDAAIPDASVADAGFDAGECVPRCDGRECGYDNCYGYCGTCGPGTECDVNGKCACVSICVVAGTPPRWCGSDGCGGTCGACPNGTMCDAAGQCVCAPRCSGMTCGVGPDGCGGTCQSGSGCSWAGCATPCSCTCPPGTGGAGACMRIIEQCRTACHAQASDCCGIYLAQHPEDTCALPP